MAHIPKGLPNPSALTGSTGMVFNCTNAPVYFKVPPALNGTFSFMVTGGCGGDGTSGDPGGVGGQGGIVYATYTGVTSPYLLINVSFLFSLKSSL